MVTIRRTVTSSEVVNSIMRLNLMIPIIMIINIEVSTHPKNTQTNSNNSQVKHGVKLKTNKTKTMHQTNLALRNIRNKVNKTTN